jgi:hypothetical protein
MKLILAVMSTAVVVVVALGVTARHAVGSAQPERSPHAEALALVLLKDAEFIAHLESDHENWWHDTKKREWQVLRPFSPGDIDSTHLFIVVYSIDGTEQAQWNVDTRAGQVDRVSRSKH